MQIKELLIGLPLLLFVFWVFAAPVPADRITRVCEPVNWVGNVATSTTALSAESHTTTSVRWSDKLNYSCKYMVWRLFYQDDYNKAVADGRVVITPVETTPTEPATTETTPTPPAKPLETTTTKPETPAAAATQGDAK